MRITRPFVLLALVALLAPRIEASRTSVWESNPPTPLTAARIDATSALASLAPVAAADGEPTEVLHFHIVLIENTLEHEERFGLGPLDLLGPTPLRDPPSSYPETRVRGFELLPPFRIGASPSLSLWGRQACGFSCLGVASDSPEDPWGLEVIETDPKTKTEKSIQKKYRQAVEEAKKTRLGREKFSRVESKDTPPLEVVWDPNYKTGMKVQNWEFDEHGNIKKAQLVVGPNFLEDITDKENYPKGSTIKGPGREKKIYMPSHEEVGHFLSGVDDPAYRDMVKRMGVLNKQVEDAWRAAQDSHPGDRAKALEEYQKTLSQPAFAGVDKEMKEIKKKLENVADEEAWKIVQSPAVQDQKP